MGLTTEDIPTITVCCLGAYSLYRLITTFFSTGRLSISFYWSRLVFRIIFIIHVVFNIITYMKNLSDVNSSEFGQLIPILSQILLVISLVFLVRSLQDFVCLNNRPKTFIMKNWIWLTLPIGVLLAELQVIRYLSSIYMKITVHIASRITYELAFVAFVIGLITVPAFFFILEIKGNDLGGSHLKKYNFALFFFAFEVIVLLANCIVEIYSIYKAIPRDFYIIFKSMRDPVIMMVCFTQDMIDWMLHWLFLSEDQNMDEDTDSKKEVTQADLI